MITYRGRLTPLAVDAPDGAGSDSDSAQRYGGCPSGTDPGGVAAPAPRRPEPAVAVLPWRAAEPGGPLPPRRPAGTGAVATHQTAVATHPPTAAVARPAGRDRPHPTAPDRARRCGTGGAERGDAELIAATRAGDLDAFGHLYSRHVAAARGLARMLTRNPADVEDLIAEAFTRLLITLRHGRGPDLAFRAYLLTAVRNVFRDRIRRDRRISLTDDLSPYDAGEPFVDPTIAELERACAARAFAKLPERWRRVLWYTEIERAPTATVAALLGLTPNGVAALAYRARERLRQMYLQEHVTRTGDPLCRWTTGRLGGYVRGALSDRDRSKVDLHLGRCTACRLLRGELGDLNADL